jgi:hypothetical protein
MIWKGKAYLTHRHGRPEIRHGASRWVATTAHGPLDAFVLRGLSRWFEWRDLHPAG